MSQKRSMIIRSLKIASYIIILAAVVWLVQHHWHDLINLTRTISPRYLVYVSLTLLPLVALTGLPFKWFCALKHCRLTFKEWAGLSFVTNFLNQIMPYRTGLGFRFYYMHRTHQFSMFDLTQITGVYVMLSLIVTALMLVGALPFSNIPLPDELSLLPLLTVILLFFGLLIALAWYRFERKVPEDKHHQGSLQITRTIMRQPSVILKTMGLMLLTRGISMVAHYFAFAAIGIHLSWPFLAVLISLITLATLLQLTPGNIGITESVVGFVTAYTMNDFAAGFSAIALFRLCNIIIAIPMGSLFSYLLVGRLFGQKIST